MAIHQCVLPVHVLVQYVFWIPSSFGLFCFGVVEFLISVWIGADVCSISGNSFSEAIRAFLDFLKPALREGE